MNDEEAQALRRENAYLKNRCAQLQDDVTDLNGQLNRLQQEAERMMGRRAQPRPDPLSGGQ